MLGWIGAFAVLIRISSPKAEGATQLLFVSGDISVSGGGYPWAQKAYDARPVSSATPSVARSRSLAAVHRKAKKRKRPTISRKAIRISLRPSKAGGAKKSRT